MLRVLEYNSTHFLIDFFKNRLLLMLMEVSVVAVQCAGWGWGGGWGVQKRPPTSPHPTSLSQADSCQESRAEA